jgi:hypothetical protein
MPCNFVKELDLSNVPEERERAEAKMMDHGSVAVLHNYRYVGANALGF